jgi:hypothetical protein
MHLLHASFISRAGFNTFFSTSERLALDISVFIFFRSNSRILVDYPRLPLLFSCPHIPRTLALAQELSVNFIPYRIILTTSGQERGT